MTKYIVPFYIIILALSSSASQIKSRDFDSKYVQMHDQEQIESMQREIQSINAKLEKLEHVISLLQAKSEMEAKLAAEDHKTNMDAGTSKNSSEAKQAQVEPKVNEPKGSIVIPKGSEKQRYDIALAALKSNDIKVAAEKFVEFIEDYPKGQFLSNAYFWYGETFLKQKIYDKAALQFLKSYKIAPRGAKSSDSLLKLADSLKELKKTSDACAMLHKLEEEFPDRNMASIKKSEDMKKQLKCN